jgi:hypothetical protein
MANRQRDAPSAMLSSPATSFMSLPRTPELEAALHTASEAHDLPIYYRDCVRPLLGAPMSRWPQCCGRGCEPCAATLVAVAGTIYDLLGLDDANAQRLAEEHEARESGVIPR